MKKQRSKKGILDALKNMYYSAPYVWYRFLGIGAAFLIWLLLCGGVFIWSEQRMQEENIGKCEEVHELLTAVEDQCKEQVKDIYKESELLEDFWLFWNHDIEGYMEQRLKGGGAGVRSFPEYMNVFLTEHKDIFDKIYFVTNGEMYSLRAAAGGGGGIYDYAISRDEYEEECRGGKSGYPISVSVQDINDKKTNVGEIVFLVNERYLFGSLKTPYNECASLEHDTIRKSWGTAGNERYQAFGMYWAIYECGSHGNKIEIGFGISGIFRRYWVAFLSVTGAVILAAGLMLIWMERIAKSSSEFL